MTNKQFGERIIESLQTNPHSWKFGTHYAQCGSLSIWIANRPYADLTIGSGSSKIGTWWQRRRIRKLMDYARNAQLAEQLQKVDVDSMLERIAQISK